MSEKGHKQKSSMCKKNWDAAPEARNLIEILAFKPVLVVRDLICILNQLIVSLRGRLRRKRQQPWSSCLSKLLEWQGDIQRIGMHQLRRMVAGATLTRQKLGWR